MPKRVITLILLLVVIMGLTGTVYAILPIGTITSGNAAVIGSTLDDRIGSEGIYALPSGNIVIASRYWNGSRGAVTCLTPAEYKGGGVIVSTANSLTGAQAGNEVGIAITVLKNGNYVVSSKYWDNGLTLNVGAVTWVNGNTCLPLGESSKGAVVSAANSLVGSLTNDQVGNTTYALTNGSYIVTSPSWDNGGALNAGAVTWGNGLLGMAGVVSPTNSLVGSTANDGLGETIPQELTNGNIVICAASWDNPVGSVVDVGAAVWMSGTTGKTGTISVSNALIGAVAEDYFGVSGVLALDNGNYVVRSRLFHNGGILNAGAITWGDGAIGSVGVVSTANSLLGSADSDQLGNVAPVALPNGSFVVRAPLWDNAGIMDAGAVVWGNGTSPLTGIISAAIGLVGQTENDYVGGDVTPLTLGGFVVSSPDWDNGLMTIDAGAATWGSDTTPLTGSISAANSLIGMTTGDQISVDGITALTNGHYVVSSPYWDNGGTTDVGAATWGDKSGSTVGSVSVGNSLIGVSTNDQISSGRDPVVLANGNYVISTRLWDNGVVQDVGAVTWVNGSAPAIGVISAANSLIGTTVNDQVGYVDALDNGDYLVRSSDWDNGGIVNAGAATLGNGSIGTVGVVGISNSLVGVTAEDQVGRSTLQPILANGNYLVVTETWDNTTGGIDVGAVTWCGSDTGCAGETLSAANSIFGSQTNDFNNMSVITYPNGDYILVLENWDNGVQADVGAIIFAQGTHQTPVVVSATTALVGVNASDNLGAKYAILPDYSVVMGSFGWDNGASLNVGAVVYVDAPINRLQNPSFETAGSTGKSASKWVGRDLKAGDKRICDKPTKPIIRTNGACVFQFNSLIVATTPRTVRQTFNNPVWATSGTVLTLAADVKGVKVGAGVKKIVLNVIFDNDTKGRAILTIPAGTYDFTTLVGTVKLTRPVKKVVVVLNPSTSKGRIHIDNLFLSASSGPSLRFPTLGENTTRDGADSLAIPPAPDGFRK